ncbi:MAG: hypothetical protein HRT87_07075 [Legionellales bacterium]|nr:hypothetical protein [Legionellales bacterium]
MKKNKYYVGIHSQLNEKIHRFKVRIKDGKFYRWGSDTKFEYPDDYTVGTKNLNEVELKMINNEEE